MTREEKFNDYDGFVAKFKPKKTTDEQTIPHPDTPTRVWELSDRERQIVAELNHKDNERPCAAP